MVTTDQPMPIVVCDAGPLIHLDELGCLDLLSDFFEVLVPEAVWREVRQHRPNDFAFFLPIPLAGSFDSLAPALSPFGLHSCSLPRACPRRSVVPIRAIRG